MPPRLRCTAVRGLSSAIKPLNSRIATRSAALLIPSTQTPRQYATAAPVSFGIPDDYIPPTKPPTARPADTRKAQLLRTYTSLLRTTPLILLFQHNNLTAVEWAAVRRELRVALREVSAPGTESEGIANHTHIQILKTRIFEVALKTIEFYDPSKVKPTTVSAITGEKVQVVHNHDLSKAAWKAVQEATKNGAPENSTYAQLEPLLVGPLAALTLPSVSPQHLAAVIKVLSPSPPKFPAPSRKKSPGYYDMHMQNGLQKLLLVGGRIENKAFDLEGVKWVGGIENGLEGLRAQVVHMLQSAGMGLTSALEGAGKSLWLTMESRRSVLEEEQNGGKEEEKKE
ncbi:hypothetical protein QBC38DRAFT_491575 [Podospora fimiseda]|uniref:Ribosomal protein YmL11, mitochondrial n=1 Tax=Podospora fimiseda TaxID=252190 RepID=A0AAN6YPS9_9PEZI|nr:hypothetical protein QBC38DRAFT_491575 [Podospora fimiseda]